MGKRRRCYECNTEITKENHSGWTPHWCLPCDKIRREKITKQLENLVKEDKG